MMSVAEGPSATMPNPADTARAGVARTLRCQADTMRGAVDRFLDGMRAA